MLIPSSPQLQHCCTGALYLHAETWSADWPPFHFQNVASKNYLVQWWWDTPGMSPGDNHNRSGTSETQVSWTERYKTTWLHTGIQKCFTTFILFWWCQKLQTDVGLAVKLIKQTHAHRASLIILWSVSALTAHTSHWGLYVTVCKA